MSGVSIGKTGVSSRSSFLWSKRKGLALVPERVVVEGLAKSETCSEVSVQFGNSLSGRNRIMTLGGRGPGQGGRVFLSGHPDRKFRWDIEEGEVVRLSRSVEPDARYNGFELDLEVKGEYLAFST